MSKNDRQWLPDSVKVNRTKPMYNYYFKMLLNRVINMFEWKNLPETVDENFLNFTLFTQGRIVWTDIDGNIYALNGNYGGKPSVYYYPTEFVIANPVLGSKIVTIGENGVMMILTDTDKLPTTDFDGGLFGLLSTTAQLLADNISSINIAQRNTRLTALVSAATQAQKQSVELALKRMYEGEAYEVIIKDLIADIAVNPIAENIANVSNVIRELVELNQYILATFYHSIGINSNYNMKRERLTSAEVNVNDECLVINVINMLKNVKHAVDDINKMFNTEITVDFSNEWKGVLKQNDSKRQDDETDNSEINSDDTADSDGDDTDTEITD